MMANRAVRSTAGGAAVACALVALVGPVAGPARANSALPGLENAASVPTDTTGAAEAEPTLRELADRAAKTAQQAVAVQDLRSRQLAASIAKELTAQAQLRAASQTRLVAAAAQVVAARAQSVAVGEQRRTLAVHQWAVTNRNAQAAAVATLRRQAQVAVADPGTSAALLLRVRNRSGLLKLWAARALATRGAYLRAEDVAIRANTKLAGAQAGVDRCAAPGGRGPGVRPSCSSGAPRRRPGSGRRGCGRGSRGGCRPTGSASRPIRSPGREWRRVRGREYGMVVDDLDSVRPPQPGG